uniref:Uncharacterized protein n=1 Tax=Musca domestica TaxID=7370 RepID=A0A1I8M489_MUSDO
MSRSNDKQATFENQKPECSRSPRPQYLFQDPRQRLRHYKSQGRPFDPNIDLDGYRFHNSLEQDPPNLMGRTLDILGEVERERRIVMERARTAPSTSCEYKQNKERPSLKVSRNIGMTRCRLPNTRVQNGHVGGYATDWDNESRPSVAGRSTMRVLAPLHIDPNTRALPSPDVARRLESSKSPSSPIAFHRPANNTGIQQIFETTSGMPEGRTFKQPFDHSDIVDMGEDTSVNDLTFDAPNADSTHYSIVNELEAPDANNKEFPLKSTNNVAMVSQIEAPQEQSKGQGPEDFPYSPNVNDNRQRIAHSADFNGSGKHDSWTYGYSGNGRGTQPCPNSSLPHAVAGTNICTNQDPHLDGTSNGESKCARKGAAPPTPYEMMNSITNNTMSLRYHHEGINSSVHGRITHRTLTSNPFAECSKQKRCGRVQFSGSHHAEVRDPRKARLLKNQIENLVEDSYCPGLIQATLDGIENFNEHSMNMTLRNAETFPDFNETSMRLQEEDPMTLLEAFAIRIDKERSITLASDEPSACIEKHFATQVQSELNQSVKCLLVSETLFNQNYLDKSHSSSLRTNIEKYEYSLHAFCPEIQCISYVGHTEGINESSN